jgi:hypothetical protein
MLLHLLLFNLQFAFSHLEILKSCHFYSSLEPFLKYFSDVGRVCDLFIENFHFVNECFLISQIN